MRIERRGSKITGNERLLRVLVSEDLFEQLEAAARLQETSVSEFVRQTIKAELRRQKQAVA